MSNRLFQTIIHQFKDAVEDRMIGVIDETDVIIACSDLGKIGESRMGIRELAGVEGGSFTSGGGKRQPQVHYIYRGRGQRCALHPFAAKRFFLEHQASV